MLFLFLSFGKKRKKYIGAIFTDKLPPVCQAKWVMNSVLNIKNRTQSYSLGTNRTTQSSIFGLNPTPWIAESGILLSRVVTAKFFSTLTEKNFFNKRERFFFLEKEKRILCFNDIDGLFGHD